jgi:glycerol-3-phosphate dehydrogenase (NAD(P)+)
MNILVLGAGAWGTALAISAAGQPGRTHRVSLWARDAAQVSDMQATRENRRYLPGVSLPPGLALAGEDGRWPGHLLADADLIIVATPMAGLRSTMARLAGLKVPVAWLCKGFELAAEGSDAGLLGHEICFQVAPDLAAGVLSGPSFALEVARGQPTALVAASEHASVREALVAAFHGPSLRVYANEDSVGVEVGGAVKNVLAIATGLCDGLNLGLNARAALITRGLAEMTRLGIALGARADTFMGLSGLGDLVLTATGDLSRNRKVGQLLAQGLSLQQAVDSLGHVAEGVYSARTVVNRARGLGVDMPISEGVVALLDGRLKPGQAVAALMGRDPKDEAQ